MMKKDEKQLVTTRIMMVGKYFLAKNPISCSAIYLIWIKSIDPVVVILLRLLIDGSAEFLIFIILTLSLFLSFRIPSHSCSKTCSGDQHY